MDTEELDASTTLADTIRRAIADEILAGEFEIGARLDEVELAKRFDVSRTPVREAIRQLASAGLVTIRPRRGAVVEPIDGNRVSQGFEAAAELEALASRWAALRGSLIDRGTLCKLNEQCRLAVDDADPKVFAAANREFHNKIGSLARNESLSEALRFVRIQIAPFQRAHLGSREERQSSFQEHDVIAEAIVHGRANDAAEAMRKHILRAGLSTLEHIMNVKDRGVG